MFLKSTIIPKQKTGNLPFLLDSVKHNKYFYPYLALQLEIKLISSIAKLSSNEMWEERKPTNNKQLLQEIKQCIQEEKQHRERELIKQERKVKIGGPKDRSASPMTNTAAHKGKMPLNDYIKAISFQCLYKFPQKYRSTEFQQDHLRSPNLTLPAQAGSARAGCPVPGAGRLWWTPHILSGQLIPLLEPPHSKNIQMKFHVFQFELIARSCLAFCAHCLTGHQSLDSSSSSQQDASTHG